MTAAVDAHAHLLVPAADRPVAGAGMGAESRAYNARQLDRLRPLLTDPAARLAAMAAMGVDAQVVSPQPFYHYDADADLGRRLARTVNEAMAAHCATAPERLTGLGLVPLQAPDLAAAELAYAVRDLGLRGVEVGSRVGERELADPAHEEFWAACAELGAVVFVHPWGCSLGDRLAPYYLSNTVGQPLETTVALSHVIFSGLLDRHPGLRILAAHGGGYLPTYAGRSDRAWTVRPEARGCRERPSAYLRRIWFDSLVYDGPALESLVRTAGPDRVLLGSDFPFDMGVPDPVARLDAARLPGETYAAIRGGNARDLFDLPPAFGREGPQEPARTTP